MFYLLIVFIVFVLFLLSVGYYVTLISSKDVYTREEIASVLPYISGSLGKLAEKYSMGGFPLVFLLSALLGIVVPFLANNLVFNSSALFVILYLVLPVVRERFASTRVAASEYYRDDIANFIARYAGLIVVGFGSGNGAALMYVWATTRELGFLWLLFNLAILCILLELALLKELREE
ncbi:MAG TPA: hypothetical protein VLM75_10575 [Spirochaetota bacterium]|nr:hypothetical protein [Spirochaetota bacterium]